ncbi:hypothetical protein JCM10207_008637 [Rhodosporidiobolus poonsookiae]
MELRTAASGYRSVSGDEEQHDRPSHERRGLSGSLDAVRATRSGTSTEWVAIRYPTRDDLRRLWASVKDPTSRAKLPFARLLSILVPVVGTLVLVALCIGGTVGYLKYRSLFHPHHAKHASKADLRNGNVVRPFFSPLNRNGLVDQVDIGISIWFREGNLTPSADSAARHGVWGETSEGWPLQVISGPDWYQVEYSRQQSMNVDGEDGFVRNETGQNSWEQIWTTQVPINDMATETRRSLSVTLPGKIVHSLVINPKSRLVALFEAHPRSWTSLGFGSPQLSHLSSRPVEKYGSDGPWPVAPIPAPANTNPALVSFLAHAGVGFDLRHHRQAWWDDQSWDAPATNENAIFTRLWLTAAYDYPVYERSSFKQALEGLRQDKERCAQRTWRDSSCRRSFHQDGHFENMLDDDGTQQYYGPFLTTRMTPATASDYHVLPAFGVMNRTRPQDVEDLRYEWTFAFSSLLPAKFVLAEDADQKDVFENAWGRSERETARRLDELELTSALIGHSFNPNARPIARTVIGGFAAFLRYLTVPLIFHYWLTRRLRVGLVLAWWFAQTVSDIVFHIVHSLTNQHYFNQPIFLIKLFGFILIGLAQLRILTGIELKFTNLLPSAIRLRGATSGERKSATADAHLDWRLRFGALFILFLGLRLAPTIPPLIRATLQTTEDPLIRLRWKDSQSPLALLWLRNLSSWSSAMWLVTRASQIHLNHRHGTFAGLHPLASYLLVASRVLSHATVVFGSFFGRAHSQGPLTTWDVVTLVVEVALAVQARRLPVVKQREEELLA